MNRYSAAFIMVLLFGFLISVRCSQAQEYLLPEEAELTAANRVYRHRLASLETTRIEDGWSVTLPLPNGTYNVTVAAPKPDQHQLVSITAESQIRYAVPSINLKQGIVTDFEVQIADGALNMVLCGFDLESTSLEISEVLKFDFGNGALAPGFVKAAAETLYDPSRGYGFAAPGQMQNRTSYASSDPLYQDAVRFIGHGRLSANSFDIDLEPGRYSFSFATGQITRMSIYVNGLPGVLNTTGSHMIDQFEMEIPEGIARITVTGKEGTAYELAWLQVKKIGDAVTPKPTIWLGGDSTVCNYYPLEPENKSVITGWGQVLPFFLTNDHTVRNYATSGQTTQGFREDGAFDGVLAQIKPGEYFIVQLGINDRGKLLDSQFKANLEYFVDQVRARGGIPVLVVPQGRADGFKVDQDGKLLHGVSGWASLYVQIRLVAFQKQVLLIDNSSLSSAYFVSIGEEATRQLFADNTHPNYYGALELARIISEDIKRQGISGIHSTPQKTNYATAGTLKLYTPELKDLSGAYIGNLTAAPVWVSLLASNTGADPRVATMVVEVLDQGGTAISHTFATQQIDAYSARPLELVIDEAAAIQAEYLRISVLNGDYHEGELIEESVIVIGGEH
ncbi:MAG: rhamnogalacturonan acetylesterase [Limnochordia bacterium]